MKKIFLLATVIAGFATTGCIVDDRGGYHHHHWRGEVTPERQIVDVPGSPAAPAALAVNQPEP